MKNKLLCGAAVLALLLAGCAQASDTGTVVAPSATATPAPTPVVTPVPAAMPGEATPEPEEAPAADPTAESVEESTAAEPSITLHLHCSDAAEALDVEGGEILQAVVLYNPGSYFMKYAEMTPENNWTVDVEWPADTYFYFNAWSARWNAELNDYEETGSLVQTILYADDGVISGLPAGSIEDVEFRILG